MSFLLVSHHLSFWLESAMDFSQSPCWCKILNDRVYLNLAEVARARSFIQSNCGAGHVGMNVKSQQHCLAYMATVKQRRTRTCGDVCEINGGVPVLEVFAVWPRRAIHQLIQHRFDKFLLCVRYYTGSLEDSAVLERQLVPARSLQSIRKTSPLWERYWNGTNKARWIW